MEGTKIFEKNDIIEFLTNLELPQFIIDATIEKYEALKPKVVPTTEDNVPLQSLTKVYLIVKHLNEIKWRYLYPYPPRLLHKLEDGSSADFKFFSTEQAAKDFIERGNKKDTVDYEILSYSYEGWIYKKNRLAKYCTLLEAPLHLLLLHTENMTTIHSVKRLSDGEVFTIGDIEKQSGTEILSIDIDKSYLSGIRFTHNDGETITDLSSIHKATILLITNDGIKVTNPEQNIYTVAPERNYYLSNTDAKWAVDKDKVYFFNEDNAKEFVNLNKQVMVSEMELIEYFNKKSKVTITQDVEDVFDEFFKQKVNL